MSAMKMDFICKDSPEKDAALTPAKAPPPPPPAAAAGGKLSALLNSSHDSDADMDAEHDAEPMDEDAAAPPPPPPAATTAALPAQSNGSVDRSSAPPPAKRAKPAAATSAAPAVVDEAPANVTDEDTSEKTGGASDNEDSEDEQAEHAAWQDVDLSPAATLVNTVVRECLEAGETYNKSITAKTTQLIMGCDSVLLELKSLSDARDSSRGKSGKQGQDSSCDCAIALGILPLVNRDASSAAASQDSVKTAAAAAAAAANSASASKPASKVDAIAEDLTDRVLLKIEASMERLRELAEMIQATSMQGEANLITKATLQDGAMKRIDAAVQASAASATAAAIAQERGRLSSAFGRLFTPLQVQKLQTWYYSYPRPLTDELTLMRTILNYRPYANPFQPHALTIAHIRDWFKRRRHRERMRFVTLALEAGRDPRAAEDEINWRLEQRVDRLRATVDLNELVQEVDKVRAESPQYDSMVAAFASASNVDAYTAASYALPMHGDSQLAGALRVKRPRAQDADLDDLTVVKSASRVEVAALQARLRSQLAQPRSASSTNALQQVVDILRSLDVAPDVRIQTGLVADLKRVLKLYRKPTLLRKSTIALLERLGMSRRAAIDDTVEGDDALELPAAASAAAAAGDAGDLLPPPPPPPSSPPRDHDGAGDDDANDDDDDNDGVDDDSGAVVPQPPPVAAAPTSAAPVSRRGKREKGRRPMKFSMQQVMALEGWFQQTYKPSQSEMEEYLDALNAPQLRDAKKQPLDVSMTQLRRWFNKRRCLRRPPFALMTQQDAAAAGASGRDVETTDTAGAAAAAGGDTDELDDDDDDVNDSDDDDSNDDSSDDSNNDSSDDDDDA